MKSVTSYLTGYALSLLLTLAVAVLVFFKSVTSHENLVFLVTVLALVQLYVQLIFFLHIADKKNPRANLTVLALTLIIVGILVGGTLWIMSNLEHLHTMPREFMHDMPTPANQLQ